MALLQLLVLEYRFIKFLKEHQSQFALFWVLYSYFLHYCTDFFNSSLPTLILSNRRKTVDIFDGLKSIYNVRNMTHLLQVYFRTFPINREYIFIVQTLKAFVKTAIHLTQICTLKYRVIIYNSNMSKMCVNNPYHQKQEATNRIFPDKRIQKTS